MKELLSALDSLLKRGLASSLTLFSLLFSVECAVGIIAYPKRFKEASRWSEWIAETFSSDSQFSWTTFFVAIVIVIGLSYVISVISEIVYDNSLRNNFDSWVMWTRKNSTKWMRKSQTKWARKNPTTKKDDEECSLGRLEKLRQDVIKTLELEIPTMKRPQYHSDYFLYEIVGRIMGTDTRGYVDAAKVLGVVFVSAVIVDIVEIAVYFKKLWFWPFTGLCLLALILYFIGREAIKTQYRSRAIRLYVNFLLTPEELLPQLLRKATGLPAEGQDQ